VLECAVAQCREWHVTSQTPIDRAVTLARGCGERGHEAWARRLLGGVTSRQARPDGATAAAHSAAAMYGEMGMTSWAEQLARD
jgi:hypothetical protein